MYSIKALFQNKENNKNKITYKTGMRIKKELKRKQQVTLVLKNEQ
jgi:hypothetical protein